MNDIEEWKRHLGLPIEIELENPQGDKFKVGMKPLTGSDAIDLLVISKNFGENEEKNRQNFTKENLSELSRLIVLSLDDIPEELKGELAGKYFLDLFPHLFNINFKATAAVSPKEMIDKRKAMLKRMEALRKDDGKSPENTVES